MSQVDQAPDPAEPPASPEAGGPTVAARLSGYLGSGGIIPPIITAIIAFVAGGLVVTATGHDPISTYKAIFNGAGLNWFFPWISAGERTTAAFALQQTLITMTPLILTGLAVAFAFRCGLFNIGAQGQYLVGSYIAVLIGSSWEGLPAPLHVLIAIVLASAAGALWAGIAGLLKATVGASEVITTIMLNWIAIWIGAYLFGLGGPLQSSTHTSVPVSNDVVQSAKLPVFWGDPQLQGLHIGLFVALAMAVVFSVLLNRTRTGYEVRAVGLNPEAARYGGISVARKYVQVMAICGVFAGLAASLDVLGWEFRIATNDIRISQVGFIGIAVALLGRNTAIGTTLAALLFGALVTGTSTRNLDPSVFPPELASNLTFIIQGLIVLLVSADLLIVFAWRWLRSRRLRSPGGRGEAAAET